MVVVHIEGAGGGPGGGRCEKKEGGGGVGDDGGEKLLLLSFGSGLSFTLFSLFLITESIPGGLGAFFNSSQAISFFSNIKFF